MNVNKLLSKIDANTVLRVAVVGGCVWLMFRVFKKSTQNIDLYTTSTAGATISQLQANSLAQKIAAAWGFINDDEDSVYAAFKALNNFQDLVMLMRAYNYRNETLVQSVNNRMNFKEVRNINSILAGKGIDFKF